MALFAQNPYTSDSRPLLGDNVGTHKYTYGIDASGKMYIFDATANKMIHYGDIIAGGKVINNVRNGLGSNVVYQGDKSKRSLGSAGGGTNIVGTAARGGTGNSFAAAGFSAGGGGGGGGGYVAPAKKLDTAQLASLDSLLSNYDQIRDVAKRKAATTRDTALNVKSGELKKERGKYDSKKLTTLQDFASAKQETDINTRNTLENLLSSLSTMNLGGQSALTRQVLDAANMSNRKANATQAQNNQSLDSAWNDYQNTNADDVKKINDQYGYDVGEADKKWAQDRQNTLYKKADVYNAADRTGERETFMRQGNDLNSMIANSVFVNPSYRGEVREMATPELANYTQDIAQYDTTGVGAGADAPLAPGEVAGANGAAIKAVAVNDKDLGVKKKLENALGYGV